MQEIAYVVHRLGTQFRELKAATRGSASQFDESSKDCPATAADMKLA